ncbi:unnamed protein product [Leptidea sinapis]|uniref:Endonuclease/exonuclease/phosphatase domain-containing protein n=1 Tax=Leptidea sinapis TaxID=189913 RepID=A0A5E4PQI9_9NEOP|nr:unnamed protein product [Leptidea sinapis]
MALFTTQFLNEPKSHAEGLTINLARRVNPHIKSTQQECWLLKEELCFLDTISEDFSSTGVSAIDTSTGILRGRPYGGVALLWKHSAFQNVSVIQCNNPRICVIKVVLQEKSFVVMSVYTTDSLANLMDFTDVLSSVSAIIDSYGENYVYILGDYNAHPFERFYQEVTQFCLEQEWTCVDTEILAHGSKRWLDHCLTTKAALDSVSNVYVLWSDHFPLVVECNLNVLLPKKVCKNTSLNERSQVQINTYQRECHERLRLIDFPHGLQYCCDHTCNDSEHRNAITKFVLKFPMMETHVDVTSETDDDESTRLDNNSSSSCSEISSTSESEHETHNTQNINQECRTIERSRKLCAIVTWWYQVEKRSISLVFPTFLSVPYVVHGLVAFICCEPLACSMDL